MTDFQDPNDPLRRNELRRGLPPDETSANATWGWVAAAVFVAVVLFIAFTSGRDDIKTANNDTSSPPAPTRMAPLTSPPAMTAPSPSTLPSQNPPAQNSTPPASNGAQ